MAQILTFHWVDHGAVSSDRQTFLISKNQEDLVAIKTREPGNLKILDGYFGFFERFVDIIGFKLNICGHFVFFLGFVDISGDVWTFLKENWRFVDILGDL